MYTSQLTEQRSRRKRAFQWKRESCAHIKFSGSREKKVLLIFCCSPPEEEKASPPTDFSVYCFSQWCLILATSTFYQHCLLCSQWRAWVRSAADASSLKHLYFQTIDTSVVGSRGDGASLRALMIYSTSGAVPLPAQLVYIVLRLLRGPSCMSVPCRAVSCRVWSGCPEWAGITERLHTLLLDCSSCTVSGPAVLTAECAEGW